MSNRYGLVYEKKEEKIVKSCREKIPFLRELKSKAVITNSDEQDNLLIEGDNYAALVALQYSHKESIDIIYIDPPYNTGNKDFVYNDRFVDKDDGYRHSKWLSFMEPRLRLARELLKPEGIIFISIDDNELYQLKLLMDQIFGERNFVANMIWERKRGIAKSKTVTKIHEYILIYAKDITMTHCLQTQKPGYSEVQEIVRKYKKKELIEAALASFYKENKHLKGIKLYKYYDDKRKQLFREGSLAAISKSDHYFTIEDPATGVKYQPPKYGWMFDKSKMNKLINDDLVVFPAERGGIPRMKLFLDDVAIESPSSLVANYNLGTSELQEMFNNKKIFNNPKPTSLIQYLISLYPQKDSIVLDFFAGSGTTGHAVLKLNREDNGSRRFILVTNNENNICRDITYPRIKKAIYGYITPKKKEIKGLGGNLRYYKVGMLASTMCRRSTGVVLRGGTSLTQE